jgi:hypothetical protein
MPYSVLSISNRGEKRVEVLAEFPSEKEANDFAEKRQKEDSDNDCDYVVERPPSKDMPPAL